MGLTQPRRVKPGTMREGKVRMAGRTRHPDDYFVAGVGLADALMVSGAVLAWKCWWL